METDAEEAVLAGRWEPLTVHEVLALGPDRLLPLSAGDVAQMVIAALGDIQEAVTGETPASRDLWDRLSKKLEFQPVSEDEFSDWLKRQLVARLARSGVWINREVQVRHPWGEGTGARTDLMVQVARPRDADLAPVRLSVVIEVKAHWNTELLYALPRQLVDRYLRFEKGRSGIYLVGWFQSPWWKDGAGRPKREPFSPDRAAQTLREQAAAARAEGFDVTSVIFDLGFPLPNEALRHVRLGSAEPA